MANRLLADHSDERQRERISPPQEVDDTRFGSIAERETGKRACSKRSNGIVVGDRFWPNQNREAFLIAHDLLTIEG